MRRGCIAVVLLALGLMQGQQSADNSRRYSGVSIPAELKTTIRADKVHRGDPVEFRSLEAVLLGNGVVMPANSKLTGRIVGAAPRLEDKPSWLVLLVERGEWKQQTVPLHAFITAQMRINHTGPSSSQNSADAPASISPRRAGRISGRAAVENGNDSSIVPPPQDSKEETSSPAVNAPILPKDLRIVRDSDGIVYLFSAESNVNLPRGALLVLVNQNPAQKPAGTAEAQPPHLR
jgi:hypothetical protein